MYQTKMEDESVNSSIELDQLIASSKDRLQNILDKLGWTIENTLKERPCAKFKDEGYSFDKNDPPLPGSFDCKNSIVVDETQLQSIFLKPNVSIPQKFSDIQLNFSREQKCKLYEYVIANTEKTSEPELKVSFPSDDADNSMTLAEIVAKAKKKDKKIQRKYRTSKPTHIEEVRNLVYLQMKALDEYFNSHKMKVHSGRRKSRSRSRNRHRNRNTDKRDDTSRMRSRSRDRERDSRSSPLSNDGRSSLRKSRSRDKPSKDHKRKRAHKSELPKSHKKHKHKEHKHHRRR